MAETFYTILTKTGMAKIANAHVLGTKVNFTTLAVGDGEGSYYNPTDTQITLKNEVWRGSISNVRTDEENLNWLIIEIVIPASIGGFMIREAGIFDTEGDMIAIAKYPETYKPIVSEGSSKDLIVRTILEIANTSAVTLKIDSSVVLATKKDINALANEITSIKGNVDNNELALDESTGHGVISGQGVKAQTVPNMTVKVESNIIHMLNGVRLQSVANNALPITAADIVNPRKDIVYINPDGTVGYLKGIPAVDPKAPSTPEGAFLMCEINVVANVTTITDGDIIDKRKIKVSVDELNTDLSNFKEETNSHLADIESKVGKIGTKAVDETDIADNYTLRYDGVKNKIVYVKSEIDREPPSKVTNISVKEDNAKLTVTYTLPLDSDYMGTRLVYNTTADPTDINDGTVIANFISGTDITGLLNDTKYFIRLFPYDMSGNYNTDIGQSITATPTEQKIYGINIDEANSNPSTRVTYIEDAIGMTPCNGGNSVFTYGSWEDVIKNEWGIKPCLLKNLGFGNAEVNYYLNPEDYKKKADGILASMLNGTDGDAMIEIPLLYYSWTTLGTVHTIKVSNKPFAGAVKYAHEIEKGYNQMNYYPLLLTQILFVLLFKSTDSQTTLGRGYVDGNSVYATTGNTDSKGFMFGESTGKQQNKFLGIEDYWDNKLYWIDGCVSNASWGILLGKSNFNDTGSGHTLYSSGLSVNTGGYMDKVQGGNDKGFIIKTSAGSETTHYCDYGDLYSSRVAYFGGHLSHGSNAGFGNLRVTNSAANANANVGSRLFYSNGVDKIYIGAYLGTTQTGKLRSVSGTTPSDTKTISVFRTEAKSNNN